MAYFKIEAWLPGDNRRLEIDGKGINRETFPTKEEAIEYIADNGNRSWRFRVVRETGGGVWWGKEEEFPKTGDRMGKYFGTREDAEEWVAANRMKKKAKTAIETGPECPKEDDMNKPLNIKRTEIIKVLDAKVKELQAERDAAAERITKDVDDALDVLGDLSATRLLDLIAIAVDHNWVRRNDDGDLEVTKAGTFEVHVDPVETPEEKLLRALQMATDTTIEVTPQDDLWRYL